MDVVLIAFLYLWLKVWEGIDQYWIVPVRKLFYFHNWGYTWHIWQTYSKSYLTKQLSWKRICWKIRRTLMFLTQDLLMLFPARGLHSLRQLHACCSLLFLLYWFFLFYHFYKNAHVFHFKWASERFGCFTNTPLKLLRVCSSDDSRNELWLLKKTCFSKCTRCENVIFKVCCLSCFSVQNVGTFTTNVMLKEALHWLLYLLNEVKEGFVMFRCTFSMKSKNQLIRNCIPKKRLNCRKCNRADQGNFIKSKITSRWSTNAGNLSKRWKSVVKLKTLRRYTYKWLTFHSTLWSFKLFFLTTVTNDNPKPEINSLPEQSWVFAKNLRHKRHRTVDWARWCNNTTAQRDPAPRSSIGPRTY